MSSNIVSLEGQRPQQRALRILLADDNTDTVLTLSALLADEGHEVRGLKDGSDVRDLVASFQPDACILDIEMPGQSGYELAREVRNRRLGDRPLLIAMSGVWARPADRFLALMVGFDHFFQKPADPNELLKVLDDFKEGRKPRAFEERVHLARRA